MLQYKHKPKAKDEKTINSHSEESFNGNDPNNLFIKEAIQNSLDNGIKHDSEGNKVPVLVRITISDKKEGIKPETYNPVLKPMMKHLNSNNWDGWSLPNFKKIMKYLVYEDFNTCGLEGDTNLAYLDPKKKKPNEKYNFLHFFRVTGISGKSGEDGGRWGIGKIVFYMMSLIKTALVITIRKEDGRELLMGETQLQPHHDGNEGYLESGYQSTGNWGLFDKGSYFCKPIENRKFISEFKKKFPISRSTEPGFSIFMPFVLSTINMPSLAYYTIEQFSHAICGGDLEVEITEGKKSIHIKKDTIFDAIESIDFCHISNETKSSLREKEEVKKMVSLVKWTYDVKEDEYFVLGTNDITLKTRWVEKVMFPDTEKIKIFQERFENGERLAFKIPVKYQPKNCSPELRYYEAFIERDSSLKKPDTKFIRGKLNLDHIDNDGNKMLEKVSARGIVLIKDPKLSSLFGDAEDISHSTLKYQSSKFREKYEDGPELIEFIKKTLKKIVEKLHRPTEGMYNDLANDLFSLPIDEPIDQPEKRPSGGKKEQGTPTETIELPEPFPTVFGFDQEKSDLFIRKYFNGVRIRCDKDTKADSIFRLKFAVASHKEPRKSFKDYNVRDFDFSKSPIIMEHSGTEILKAVGNKLHFKVTDPENFEINILGFYVKNRGFICGEDELNDKHDSEKDTEQTEPNLEHENQMP